LRGIAPRSDNTVATKAGGKAVMLELTVAELDQVFGGVTGAGVATAITEGGTTEVLNAVPGLVKATANPGPDPAGHGTLTAPGT
jgi:hypothetical protein